MISGMLAFATMGTLAHGLRDEFGWEVIAFVRSVVVLILSGIMAATGGVRLRFRRPAAMWVRSIAGTICMYGVFYSFSRLPVGIVVTLLNLAPAWVAILSWPLLKHKAGAGVWLAIGIGMSGVVLIQRPQVNQGNYAVLVVFGASILLAIVMMSLHWLKDVDKRATVFHFAAVSAIGCFGAVLASSLTTSSRWSAEPVAWLMLVGVGVAATIGQIGLTAAFALGPPAKISVVALTQVGFAMLYDIFLWGHAYDMGSLLGIVLVLAPAAWLLLWERRVLDGEVDEM